MLTFREFIQGNGIHVAFVSTNSIVQGEQVEKVWGLLSAKFAFSINFAHRTFVWSNEAKGKAAVHCIIIGFSHTPVAHRFVFDEDGLCSEVDNINFYLMDAENIIVKSRTKPLSDVPKLTDGNRPTDGGNLIIEEADYEEFIEKEPNALPYIKRYMMASEFINNKKRYCLWLVNCSPAVMKKLPYVLERVELVRKTRMESPDVGAQRLAETPYLFRETRNPNNYIVIPFTSSSRRKYIPIGYLHDDTIAGAGGLFMLVDAGLYHFGVLTSNVHNAWIRAVCGRLKSDYRYSKDIVYNNFPWPDATDAQKTTIETLAQGVLDARATFPDSSLADLYDPLTMPPNLLKAHQKLDKAVWAAYGFSPKVITSEAACVAALMERYRGLVEKEKA